MRTPVSRFEKSAAVFILLIFVPLGFLFYVSNNQPGGLFNRSSFDLRILADEGMDLSAGDKVMMKGIQIGEVDDLELREDHKILILCSIYNKYARRITTDAVVHLVPPAVVGSARIEIQPGVLPPLPSGETVAGRLRPSIQERADALLAQAGSIIENANSRIHQLEVTLNGLQKILDEVNNGKGSLGKFIYEEEFYSRLSVLVGRLENASSTVEKLKEPLLELSGRVPALSANLLSASEKLDAVLGVVAEGLEEFPETAGKVRIALAETRKILESLKRNFLIRGNLPRDAEIEGTAPASLREAILPR